MEIDKSCALLEMWAAAYRQDPDSAAALVEATLHFIENDK